MNDGECPTTQTGLKSAYQARALQTAQRVVVVNQTLVDRYLKGTSPLGHTVGDASYVATIVGVTRDSKYASSDEDRCR
jgi:hypothetical protein